MKSLVAILLLVAALIGSGFLLKQAYEANGSLKQSMAEQDAAIKRLSAEALKREADATKLSTLLTEREVALREARNATERAKQAARVVVQNDPDLALCASLRWPDDLMQLLRENAVSRDPNRRPPAASASFTRL